MDTDTKINEKAVELLRSVAQNEYSNEQERTSTIDSKAGIALPIIAAYFLALAEMNDYKSMLSITISNVLSFLIPFTVFVTYTAALVCAFIAVIWMARVIFTREYHAIDPKDMYDDDYLKTDSIVLSIALLDLYFDAIDHNRRVNKARAKLYERGWLFAFISLICFIVYMIIRNNLF